MNSVQEQLNHLKAYELGMTDSEEDYVSDIDDNISKIITSENENPDLSEDNNDGFTKVGSGGKPIKNQSNENPLWSQKVKGKSNDDDDSTTIPSPIEDITSFKPQKFKFGVFDKKANEGLKPNFMLNPEKFQEAIYYLCKQLNDNVFPEVDLFADQYNKQPGVKKHYHYNKSNQDKNFDAFTQDWSQFKIVYGNFFWGKMHEVILKAQRSKVNLITFLDVSEEASVHEYYELYKTYCPIQYNYTVKDDLWVNTTKNGYQKFLTPHLPRSDGQYALCFFNFNETTNLKLNETINIKLNNFPELKTKPSLQKVKGRITKTFTTAVSGSGGEKFSVNKNPDGHVTLKKMFDGAENISSKNVQVEHDVNVEPEQSVKEGKHEKIFGNPPFDDTINTNDSQINTLELKIKEILDSKSLDDERELFSKKKARFEFELLKYSEYLTNFKEYINNM